MTICNIPYKNKRVRWLVLALLPIVLISYLSTTDLGSSGENDDRDSFAVVSNDGELILYDPYTLTQRTLAYDVKTFLLGYNGEVAFTREVEDGVELYIMNVQTRASLPIKIDQAEANYKLDSWTTDGRLLFLSPYPKQGRLMGLYIWNGEEVLTLARGWDIRLNGWTPDERLVIFRDSHGALYVWDGLQVLNLTENLGAGSAVNAVWHESGKLVFVFSSDRPRIYIWDQDTQIDITPNNEPYDYSRFVVNWSEDGRLAFSWLDEIYVWDGEATIKISHESESSKITSSGQTADAIWPLMEWSEDGRLAFSLLNTVYVWDGDTTINVMQMVEKKTPHISWSKHGYLKLSYPDDEGNRIYIWDGQSFADGEPAVYPVFPELRIYDRQWTDDGHLAFTIGSYNDADMILWDVETQLIANRFPVLGFRSGLSDDGKMVISRPDGINGLGANYIEIMDIYGNMVFTSSGPTQGLIWSRDGQMASCKIEQDRGWMVYIWDGEPVQQSGSLLLGNFDNVHVWDVISVYGRPAGWINQTQQYFCFSG